MSIVRKITVNCELLQISKMTKLPKVRKMTSLKIYISPSMKKLERCKFGEQVNLIQNFPLGKLPQEVVTLPHNYVILANHFTSSYRGATIIKIGQ